MSKLQEQVQKVDVAKAKYYPQVNAGMNNGTVTPTLILDIPPH